VKVGFFVWDLYDTYKTLSDNCQSNLSKATSVGLLAAGLISPFGKQVHHLIPKSVFNEFKHVIDSRYLLNHAENLMELPIPFHLGSHPQYNKYVQKMFEQLTKEGQHVSLDAMRKLQNTLRNEIQQRMENSSIFHNLNSVFRGL
jgi:hypothetical protein